MQVATTGLVLRQVKVGEADRILTILTPDLGVVSASARGSLRMKSALTRISSTLTWTSTVSARAIRA